MTERVIGRFGGKIQGPLVLVFAGIHGNETAGIVAMEKAFQMLHDRMPGGEDAFAGALVALKGNLPALKAGQRFIDRDLNRMWTPEHIHRIQQAENIHLSSEDKEMAQLLELVHHALYEHQPEVLIILDLHTTSADGGIFVIPANTKASLRLAKYIHAPVVLGLLEGIEGSLLHFTEGNHFAVGGYPKQCLGIAFEGGQHNDPASIDRCLAALFTTLRSAGCMPEEALAGPYDMILHQYASTLPEVTRLRYVHHIRPGDGFRMRPGYRNFQPIDEGEHLADDAEGPVKACCQGLILMPLYQAIGSDGFFVVEAV
ncbi:MAG: succinylglutamate desuccinylase/aspartoacylase family protein [Saprospiraceae bacterium]|nr:succinylglutamate desuccinylase/aspartoacylase family protein [Saprospiraceae bacterium]